MRCRLTARKRLWTVLTCLVVGNRSTECISKGGKAHVWYSTVVQYTVFALSLKCFLFLDRHDCPVAFRISAIFSSFLQKPQLNVRLHSTYGASASSCLREFCRICLCRTSFFDHRTLARDLPLMPFRTASLGLPLPSPSQRIPQRLECRTGWCCVLEPLIYQFYHFSSRPKRVLKPAQPSPSASKLESSTGATRGRKKKGLPP